MTKSILASTRKIEYLNIEAPNSVNSDRLLRYTLKSDLFILVGIKNELEGKLHRSVDIVTYRENMNKFLIKI